MKKSTIATAIALLLPAMSANAVEVPSTHCPMPLLRRNDHQKKPNRSVKVLQRRLREYNILVKVDGFFGKKTEDAVIEYQQRGSDHDPEVRVDGIVGKDTWSMLLVCPRKGT
jgi:peptidoglycan hydrolase-like protein with peptidoglycan-binding domain